MSPTTTGPLFRATRAEKPASPRALRAALHAVSSRWISTAARAARRAWSACGTGAPKKAITQSPMNLSSVPPAREEHGGAGLGQADRLAAGEARVGLRVEGPQRHPRAHHRAQHGARHRHLGGRAVLHLVLDARQLADELAALPREEDEAAVDR